MNLQKNANIISLVCLIVLVVVAYFVFRPLVGKLNQENVSLRTKSSELEQKEKKLKTLEELKSKVEAGKATLQTIQKSLPKGEDLPSLLVSMESLIGSSGLALSSFSVSAGGTSNSAATAQSTSTPPASSSSSSKSGIAVGEEAIGEEQGATRETSASATVTPAVTAATGIGSSSISLGLSGNYGSFLNFLANVNKNIRPTVIDSMSVSGQGDSLTIQVSLTTYYQQ